MTRSPTLFQRWNDFWFAKERTNLMCLLRLYFGLWMVSKRTEWWGLHRLDEWKFPPGQKYTRHIEDWDVGPDAFPAHFPYMEWVPIPSFEVYQWMQWSWLPLGILVAIGLCTRITAPLLAGTWLWWVLMSQHHYAHHVSHLAWVFVLIAFSQSGDHYSVDAWIRKSSLLKGRFFQFLGLAGPIPATRSATTLRMSMVLLSAIYLSATWGKLNWGYFSGEIFGMLEAHDHFRGPLAQPLWQAFGGRPLGWLTLAAEGGMAIGIWFPQTRALVMWLGVTLHTGVDIMMPVTTFSYQITSHYLVFCRTHPKETVLLYDPSVRLHQSMARVTRLLNWLDRIRFEPRPGAQLHAISPTGIVHRGARGALEVSHRLPVVFLGVGPIWWLWRTAERLGWSKVLKTDEQGPAAA